MKNSGTLHFTNTYDAVAQKKKSAGAKASEKRMRYPLRSAGAGLTGSPYRSVVERYVFLASFALYPLKKL